MVQQHDNITFLYIKTNCKPLGTKSVSAPSVQALYFYAEIQIIRGTPTWMNPHKYELGWDLDLKKLIFKGTVSQNCWPSDRRWKVGCGSLYTTLWIRNRNPPPQRLTTDEFGYISGGLQWRQFCWSGLFFMLGLMRCHRWQPSYNGKSHGKNLGHFLLCMYRVHQK